MKNYKSLLVWIILIGGFLAIQFIPVNFENPSGNGLVPMDEETEAILQKACFDCHSNSTEYPWYSRVAPVSFMISHHIAEGRGHLNFSDWDSYSADRQQHKLSEVVEEVREGKMPPYSYTLMHPGANLDEVEKLTLYRWAGEVSDYIEEMKNSEVED